MTEFTLFSMLQRPATRIFGFLSCVALLGALLPATTAHAAYRVGAGDLLQIEIYGHQEVSGEQQVSQAGTIELNLIGEVKVEGMSPEQVDQLITQKLSKFLREPTVTVNVKEFHSQKVYITGAVEKPGRYVLKGERRLLDLLLEAGGPSKSVGAQVHVLRRAEDAQAVQTIAEDGAASEEDGEHIIIDLSKLLAEGDFSQNVTLQGGDVVYIPGARGEGKDGAESIVKGDGTSVYVLGEVVKPGVFPLESGATALAAVLAAGGLTKFASAARAKVVRNEGKKRKVYEVDLDEILKKGNREKDVRLQPGDMVIIPSRIF